MENLWQLNDLKGFQDLAGFEKDVEDLIIGCCCLRNDTKIHQFLGVANERIR